MAIRASFMTYLSLLFYADGVEMKAQMLPGSTYRRYDLPARSRFYGAGEVNGLPFSITKVAMAFTGDVPLLMPSWILPGSM